MQSIISYLWASTNNNIAILVNSNLDYNLAENLIKKYSPDIIITQHSNKFKNYNLEVEINKFFI